MTVRSDLAEAAAESGDYLGTLCRTTAQLAGAACMHEPMLPHLLEGSVTRNKGILYEVPLGPGCVYWLVGFGRSVCVCICSDILTLRRRRWSAGC